jgi:hypothetical protein
LRQHRDDIGSVSRFRIPHDRGSPFGSPEGEPVVTRRADAWAAQPAKRSAGQTGTASEVRVRRRSAAAARLVAPPGGREPQAGAEAGSAYRPARSAFRRRSWRPSRRTWRKLHLAVDAASGRIVAQTLTDQDVDDPSQVGSLLDQIDDPIVQVTADGAYDGSPTYQTVAAHNDGIEVVIPPRATAVPSGELDRPTQRDRPLALMRPSRTLGGEQEQNGYLALGMGWSRWPGQPEASSGGKLFTPRFWTVSRRATRQKSRRRCTNAGAASVLCRLFGPVRTRPLISVGVHTYRRVRTATNRSNFIGRPAMC